MTSYGIRGNGSDDYFGGPGNQLNHSDAGRNRHDGDEDEPGAGANFAGVQPAQRQQDGHRAADAQADHFAPGVDGAEEGGLRDEQGDKQDFEQAADARASP